VARRKTTTAAPKATMAYPTKSCWRRGSQAKARTATTELDAEKTNPELA
jgi:hypothetical protein